MIGISWGGFNALQVAAMEPQALKAIILSVLRLTDMPMIFISRWMPFERKYGMGIDHVGYSSRPPDPALVGDRWREMWLARLENEPYLPMTWLKHQTRDAYWQHGSVCEDYSAIKAATLAVGGWGTPIKIPLPISSKISAHQSKGLWAHGCINTPILLCQNQE